MSQVLTFDSEEALERALNEAASLPARWAVVAKGGKFTAVGIDGDFILEGTFVTVQPGTQFPGKIVLRNVSNRNDWAFGTNVNVKSNDLTYDSNGVILGGNVTDLSIDIDFTISAGTGIITEVP